MKTLHCCDCRYWAVIPNSDSGVCTVDSAKYDVTSHKGYCQKLQMPSVERRLCISVRPVQWIKCNPGEFNKALKRPKHKPFDHNKPDDIPIGPPPPPGLAIDHFVMPDPAVEPVGNLLDFSDETGNLPVIPLGDIPSPEFIREARLGTVMQQASIALNNIVIPKIHRDFMPDSIMKIEIPDCSVDVLEAICGELEQHGWKAQTFELDGIQGIKLSEK